MDLVTQKLSSNESESYPPITLPQNSIFGSHLHSSSSHPSFPIIAVAIIGILATGLLLVGYYIFVIKCCLNWHRIDIFRRFSRRNRVQDPLMEDTPVFENRGLDEAAIRSIPISKFSKKEQKSCECAICLNNFQEDEKLKVIPNCAHVFHIDCIDVWLQNNANCPLCRISVSAIRPEIRFPLDQVLDPSPSNLNVDHFTGRDEDYVVIEIEPELEHSSANVALLRVQEGLNSGGFLSMTPSPRKLERKILRRKAKKINLSSMGDECIDNRKKDEQFAVQPLRRSFSMDSAEDSRLYLAVQDIILQEQRQANTGVGLSEDCRSRSKRSLFSFGGNIKKFSTTN